MNNLITIQNNFLTNVSSIIFDTSGNLYASNFGSLITNNIYKDNNKIKRYGGNENILHQDEALDDKPVNELIVSKFSYNSTIIKIEPSGNSSILTYGYNDIFQLDTNKIIYKVSTNLLNNISGM